MRLKAISTILILVLPSLLFGRGRDDRSPARGENSATASSPFGIYSPLGELQLDRSTFATPTDISRYLKDIGVKWVQEMPFVRGFDAIPDEMNIYSRVGKEAGMNPLRINDPVAVERYKVALAQRIRSNKDRAKFWEVDTEPDGLGGWRRNPRGYAELLRITYVVIKRECADCKVMFGGLSGGHTALDAQSATFLEEALQAGAAGYFDGLEFKRHHTSSRDYSLIKNKFESIGEILSKHGVNIHAIPVFVETAMYDGDPNDPVPHPGNTLPVQTEREQAQGLLKTYVYGLSLGIDKIFWNLVFERSDYEPNHAKPFPQNPFNHYGLIHNPTNHDRLSGKKLAYYTYKKMVEMLEGSDWKGIQTIRESGNVRIYKLVKNGKPIYVAWWDYLGDPTYSPGKTLSVSLAGLQGATASVTEALPKFATGAEVTAYSTAFRKVRLTISNRTVTLSLGDSPVFVEVQP